MHIDAGKCVVRSWQAHDARSLADHANNPEIWRNVRDGFPSPYTLNDARAWLLHLSDKVPETDFAIDIGGNAIGAIGFVIQEDVHRLSAEMGYWLGRRYWGKGIVTAAVEATVPYMFETFGLVRIHSRVFSTNTGSARVLEKAGFVLEATLRNAVVKDGRILDEFLFAKLKSEQKAGQ
jgi:RimJ/RimL family protein N-acetyltransferase